MSFVRSVRVLAVATATVLLLCFPACAANYYVSGTGDDQNNGLTEASAFRNIQTAANLTQPGDVVLVMDGTYATDPAVWHDAVVLISRSGTSAQHIFYQAYTGAHPVITTAANANVWDAVKITAAYIDFSGFEVVGSAQNVTLSQAATIAQQEIQNYNQSVAMNKVNPTIAIRYPDDVITNGNCISVERTDHVIVSRNLVHDCSASGITAQASDYISIKSNVVFNSSWWTVLDTSGINVFEMRNSDGKSGYKNYVMNNISHDNANTQPFYNFAAGGGVPTDGNGIIIDSNQLTNDGQPYAGRTLVMGNVVYNNGGSGIHAFFSNHVDLYNNTAFMNNSCPIAGSTCGNINEGQIFAAYANDVNIYNNIMYAPAGKWAYTNTKNSNVTESNNLLFSPGGQIMVKEYPLNPKDIVADPLFTSASSLRLVAASPQQDAYEIANPTVSLSALRPLKSSPARGTGTTTLTNGQPMATAPAAMGGNDGAKVGIGAIATPSAK